MRRRPVLLSTGLSAALLVSLAACAPSAPATVEGCLPAGAASQAVTVDGAFGSTPTVEFEAPLTAETTERSVTEEGEGDGAADGDTVVFEYTLYNGETGEEIETTGFGEEGVPALNLSGSETLVFVIDVIEVQTPPEPVTPGAWTEGVPEVDLGVTPPVVTLPEGGAPDELVLAVLEQGDGDVVGDDATVLVDYQGTSWQTGEIFDQSFGAQPATFPVTGVIQGFAAGLIGQQVGTTLLVSIPADLAYGTDPEAHPLGGQDLLFLVTIIDIVE